MPTSCKDSRLGSRNPRDCETRSAPNAYADLLFVYSWTAILHWLVIVLSFALVLVVGFDHRLGGTRISTSTRVFDGLLVLLVSYATMQFLITVVTLSQVGRHYIRELRDRQNGEAARSGRAG
jgi:uncharacterized membrane protein (DUF485 family)